MSSGGNEDVRMEVEGDHQDSQPPNTVQPNITPRVLIKPNGEFTFRPFPDGRDNEVALDWAAEKETELAAKEKKARRKEKRKEKKAMSMMETDAAPAALKAPTDTPEAEKTPGTKSRKRKNEIEQEATKKRKATLQTPEADSQQAKPTPPTRKEEAKGKRAIQNKKKKEAVKSKKAEAIAAVEQPVEDDESKNRAIG